MPYPHNNGPSPKYEVRPDTADGAMFWQKEKRSEKAPDVKGHLTFDAGLIRLLVQAHRDGKELKVDIAGWNRTSKAGDVFLSVKVTMPYERDAGRQTDDRSYSRPMAAPARAAPARRAGGDMLDDEIPF